MIELVYNAAAGPAIQKRFPHAQIEDASDDIHESRIQIVLPDADRDAFYKHALREGYYEACMGFQLMMRGDASDKEQIRKWLDEVKAEPSA